MTYGHSFSSDFYGDPYNATASRKPRNVSDALASMPERQWKSMVREVFPKANARAIGIPEVLTRVLETNTVTDLRPPVEVWIDAEGYHTVLVHDSVDAGADGSGGRALGRTGGGNGYRRGGRD